MHNKRISCRSQHCSSCRDIRLTLLLLLFPLKKKKKREEEEEQKGKRKGKNALARNSLQEMNYCVVCCIYDLTVDKFCSSRVLAGSPSRGGDVAVYVSDINQQSFPTSYHSVLVSRSVFMALSTVFHSINSPDNSPVSHSVLPVLFLLD